jgi:predicted MFS family arabinose efflux permease
VSTTGPSPPPFSRGYSWYVLSVLLVVYVFNFIDRQILAIVVDDIKAELQLSDTGLGLLLGFAFVMFYTTAGLPIARWADRGSRRSIIALGLTVWSAMTAACGLAQTFWQLAMARFGVGIGEAAGTPPSHSLISDYFPPERRATALSVYAMGIYLGVMFGFLAGGFIRDAFDWRMAFLAVGLPGIPLALLVRFTVREPERGASDPGEIDTETPPLREVLRTLFARRSFVYLTLGGCFQALSGYAVLSWGPAFLGRVHQMSGTEIGTTFGLIAGIGGAVGATLGGVLVDRLVVRDVRWCVWLPALISVVAVPFAVPFYLAESTTLALLAFAPFYLLNNMYVGPLWSVTQGLVKVRMRAVASATLLTILNLVGLGLGPLLVGFMNDRLAPTHGAEAIRYSLLVMAGAGALAAIFFGLCSRTIRDELES